MLTATQSAPECVSSEETEVGSVTEERATCEEESLLDQRRLRERGSRAVGEGDGMGRDEVRGGFEREDDGMHRTEAEEVVEEFVDANEINS